MFANQFSFGSFYVFFACNSIWLVLTLPLFIIIAINKMQQSYKSLPKLTLAWKLLGQIFFLNIVCGVFLGVRINFWPGDKLEAIKIKDCFGIEGWNVCPFNWEWGKGLMSV